MTQDSELPGVERLAEGEATARLSHLEARPLREGVLTLEADHADLP